MDKFRTIIPVKKVPFQINIHSSVMLIGSCFTRYIGEKMAESKFPVLINPFGVLYNPVSIANCLSFILDNKSFTKDELEYRNKRYFSYFHDTGFSNIKAEKCLEKINDGITHSHFFLKKADFLFVTFGTSLIYELKKTGMPVSNCHKIPAGEFSQRLLWPEEITRIYKELIHKISSVNPNLKIIFTVSPVRHWKDGAEKNQLSKSILFVSIYKLLGEFPDKIFYFPAYELLMDDLRDYRFYDADMLHPNQVAIDYIWDYFVQTFLDSETKKLLKEIETIRKAYCHKPFDESGEEFKKFARNNLFTIQRLIKKNSFLDFTNEIEHFRKYV